jgi:hypothetical protein
MLAVTNDLMSTMYCHLNLDRMSTMVCCHIAGKYVRIVKIVNSRYHKDQLAHWGSPDVAFRRFENIMIPP